MQKQITILLFSAFAFCILPCCSKKKSCDELFKLVHHTDSQYKNSWSLKNEKVISCTFLPVSYQICQQERLGTNNEQLVTKNELEEEITFMFEFPFSEYAKSEEYFMFDLEKNLTLEQNQLQINPIYCFLEQSYGINGYQKIFSSFNKQQINISMPLKIIIKQYLNEGIDIHFEFTLKDLQI